jgi:hypothetical protein
MFQEIAAEAPGTGLGFVLAKCARDILGMERMARHQATWRPILPRRTEFAFDRRMRRISRLREQWRRHLHAPSAAIDALAVLFRSWARDADAPADLNWRSRCPNLPIVCVEGDHRTMLDPPYRFGLCQRFAEALGLPEKATSGSAPNDQSSGFLQKDLRQVSADQLFIIWSERR